MVAPALLAALLVGCTSTEPEVVSELPEAGSETAPTKYGWISEVALQPDAFAALLEETGRDGWIAFHRHDYRAAADALTEPRIRARAHLAQSVFYDDLARVSGVAHEQLFSEWKERGTLPKGNDAPLVAALASYCSDGATTVSWAQQLRDGEGMEFAQALMGNRSPFDVHTVDPFGRRFDLHRSALEGQEEGLLAVAKEPVIKRDEAGGFVRRFFDPCLYRTLSQTWANHMLSNDGLTGSSWREMVVWTKEGLGGRLFAAWATAADLNTEAANAAAPGHVGAKSALLRSVGIGVDAMPTDDPQQARDLVRLLDQALEKWNAHLRSLADDDGQALLSDLGLVKRFRQEWLVARARLALHNGRPQQALTYIELGREPGEKVGPANAPALMAVMAEAQLKLGRTREALDSLQLLVDRYPEVTPLTEVVGDLSVLRGLDRTGDSKEDN